ncbi:unnamed protein product [Angiostrongylus costaricensis]|uniref:CX domain-containing protein n=1 Tax=Angiostrongylus costaricensis TaxID=334426 RepID=A0A0R3PGU1_ANGCS|nr:unnamed protein product [Angiostrongylus costaricensis]
MLAFEAGKAIIQSLSTPFNYNGQNYYWDKHPNVRNSDIECSISIDELQKLSGSKQQARAKRQLNSSTTTSPSPTNMAPDDILKNLQYPNGTRPQQITWVCKRQYEVCCGTDCCPSDEDFGLQSIGWIIGIIAALVLAACCCFGLCYVLKNTAEQNQRRKDVLKTFVLGRMYHHGRNQEFNFIILDTSMMPHLVHNLPSPNDSNCIQPNPYSFEPLNDQYTNTYDSQQRYPQYPQQGYPQYPQQGYPPYPHQGYQERYPSY